MSCKLLSIATSCATLATAADIPALPWEKSRMNIGRDLFRENCAVCHDIDKDRKHTRKIGPSLNHLFKNEKLPLSHGKPNRPYVVIRIKFGGSPHTRHSPSS